MKQVMTIHYDPRLIEEVVFHAQRNRHDSGEFDERRSRIYEVADHLDERERLFSEFNRSWFDRLGLGKTIELALQEQPLITSLVESCFVVCAAQTKEEGTELFVSAGNADIRARRTVRILIQPASLLKADRLRTFLRHELFHIADMLDPAFAYEPTLPKAEGGPTYDTLITNRYRVLWDVTIAGRMARRGWLTAAPRDQQLEEFHRAFPMLDAKSEEIFNRFSDAAEPRHRELAEFAFDPRAATDNLLNQAMAGTHCSLCRFPTHAFASEPANLGTEVLAAIKEDFPNWAPAQGLCVQCADLYRARQLSLAAAKQLPGWSPCPARA